MSIILTHAYYLYEDAVEQRIMKPYVPLGLLYLSAYLNQNNIENHVYDSTFYSKELQLEFITIQQPKLVAIYANLMTKPNVITLVRTLKQEAKYGFPKVILGGPDVSYNCDNYLKTGADYLIIGEGEQTFLELSNAILNNNEIKDIPGLVYREETRVIKTTPRSKIKDLSTLPLPNRDAVPMENYMETWKTHHGKSSMTVSTQRGCPYTCKWCSTAVYGQSYRRRPVKQVVEELMWIKKRYNPDYIWFVDDVFTVSQKWIKSFYSEMIKQNVSISYECITRAERLNTEVFEMLKASGCYRIWIGAESGSQNVIDRMDRRIKVNTVKRAIQETNELGIETGTFIMVGYPGETEDDIFETIKYLKDANPTHFTITVTYPIKGTTLYNEISSDIKVNPEWNNSTDRDIDFKRTYTRKYYNFAVKHIINEVNYHKARLNKTGTPIFRLKLKLKSLAAKSIMKILKLI